LKVYILTFHCAKNYGAVLQAYALKKVLERYTDDVSFINYRPRFLTDRRVLERSHNISLKYLIIEFARKIIGIIRYYFWGYKQKIGKYVAFEKEYLLTSTQNCCTKKEEIDVTDADFVFLGSDQIWNRKITFGDTAYLGDFRRNKNTKLVSYAASIGLDNPTAADLDFIRENIYRLHRLSVREETAKNIISGFAQQQVEVVLDPTLLPETNEWDALAILPKYEKYLLLYAMGNNKLTEEVAKKIAKIRGLNIIEISSGGRSARKIYDHGYCGDAGPREFIGLVQNAEFVVTSSFHGTAFSLIFNKQFYTIPHDTAKCRMTDLLARIKLKERMITSKGDLNARINLNETIDYKIINKMLDAERRKSIRYIEEALGINSAI